MHKSHKSINCNSTSSSKKKILLTTYVILSLTCGFFAVHVADTLEGTPEVFHGVTVYTANVEPGQSYTSLVIS